MWSASRAIFSFDVWSVKALLFGAFFSVDSKFINFATAFLTGVIISVDSDVTAKVFALLHLAHRQVCGLYTLPGWEPCKMCMQAMHFLSAFQP